MTVLIAGASGYIGSMLSVFLADSGFKIIALCNNNIPNDEKWKAKMFKIIQVDVSSFDAVEKLSRFEVDAVINLVSLNHYDSNLKPDFVNSINVTPTWNFLNVFFSKNLKKFIYFSTIHVYGNKLTGEITESNSTSPVNQYGLTHLLSEEVVNYYSNTSDVDCYNVRLSNGYGAPQFMENKCWDLVINNLCLSAWKKQELILKSDGSPVRDFIHLSDVLEGIKRILLSEKTFKSGSAEVLNFSSGNTISMLDAAMIVKDVFQKKYGKGSVVYVNGDQPVSSPQPGRSANYTISNARFKTLLADKGLHELSFGINELFDFLDTKQNNAGN